MSTSTAIARREVDFVPALTERDTIDGWIETVAPVARLAESIANTDFVPKALRGKPAAIMAAILYGRELKMGPLKALQTIHVIDGRPGISAEMARAMAFSEGHSIHIEESTTERCIARGKRANADEWVQVTWTMDDAKRAGLAGKDNWRKQPRRMLQARATGELCHLLFADAIGGMPFTIEEIEDDGDAAGAIGAVAEEAGGRTAQRSRRQRQAPKPKDEQQPGAGSEPALPGDEDYKGSAEPGGAEPAAEPAPPPEPPPAQGEAEDQAPADAAATRAQVQKIVVAYNALEIDRGERLATSGRIVGREIASANDLTKAEASVVIDTLERLGDGEAGAERLRALIAALDQAGDDADARGRAFDEAKAPTSGDEDDPQGALPVEGSGRAADPDAG